MPAATTEPLSEQDQHAADMARLEAEAERRRAAAAAAERPDRQPSAFGDLAEKLAAKMRNAPANDAQRAAWEAKFGTPWDDLAEHKRDVRMGAWRRDVTEARHANLLGWRLDDLDADQHPQLVRRFVDEFHAGNRAKPHLVLAGGVGPGKTTAAVAAGSYAAELGMTVRFINHAAYLAMLRPNGSEDPAWKIRKRYVECDLLILDDLGVSLGDLATTFTQNETHQLVDDRGASGKATIFTTNLRSDDLEKPTMLGKRTMSRIGQSCIPVMFEGPDRRQPARW